MKNIIVTILSIFCTIAYSYSQSNFKNGYIIENSNDTIRGLIDFRTDDMNAEICKFKVGMNEPEQQFLPGEIYGYRFVDEGKFYVSKTVTIDSISHNVFLEFLVQGIKNLYYLPWDNGYYLFENPDGSLFNITKKDDKLIDNYKLKADNRYKGFLSYVFRDYLPIAANTNNVLFNKKSMIDLTVTYHDKMCDSGESCILFENDYKKKFTKFSALVYSGIELNMLTNNTYSMPTMSSISPIVGTTLGVSSPRLFRPLWLELDVNVSRLVSACDYIYPYSNNYIQYKVSGIKVNYMLGLKYIFHYGKYQPYISCGLGQTRIFNMKDTYSLEYLDTGSVFNVVVTENKLYTDYLYDNIIIGAGIERKITNMHYVNFGLLYSQNFNSENVLISYQLKLGLKF